MTCSLATALRYRNRHLIDRFVEHYKVSEAEALEIFDQVKKWLWLNSLPGAPTLSIGPSTLIIDEMWHTFLLFSEAYTSYCKASFGHYIHHRPTTEVQKRKLEQERARDPDGFARRRRRRMARQYRFILEHLGPHTLRRWYAEYPLRYDRAFFARLGIELPEYSPEVAERLADLRDEQPDIRSARP